MRSGILLIDKAAGASSAREISRAKARLGLRKIGHAGTLDPFATGLLICPVNSATRLAAFAKSGEKIYSGIIRLGLSTDSDDITGKKLEESRCLPAEDLVCAAAREFSGEIKQTPPQFSALKIDGQRAYRAARRGEKLDLPQRTVTVSDFEIKAVEAARFSFRLRCSPGTYVRAIARDLGQRLGCGACLEELRREASAPFRVEQARPVDELSEEDIRDWRELFPGAAALAVSGEHARRMRSGDQRAVEVVIDGAERCRLEGSDVAIYTHADTDEPLGLLVRNEGRWRLGVNLGLE